MILVVLVVMISVPDHMILMMGVIRMIIVIVIIVISSRIIMRIIIECPVLMISSYGWHAGKDSQQERQEHYTLQELSRIHTVDLA